MSAMIRSEVGSGVQHFTMVSVHDICLHTLNHAESLQLTLCPSFVIRRTLLPSHGSSLVRGGWDAKYVTDDGNKFHIVPILHRWCTKDGNVEILDDQSAVSA